LDSPLLFYLHGFAGNNSRCPEQKPISPSLQIVFHALFDVWASMILAVFLKPRDSFAQLPREWARIAGRIFSDGVTNCFPGNP